MYEVNYKSYTVKSTVMKRRKKEWFDDDSVWIDLYSFLFPEKRFQDAVQDTEKILALAKPRGKSVLDLCCGPGRFSVELAKRGFDVTGVDRTLFLLDKAKQRAKSAKVKVEWIQQDMREFLRPEGFDLILNVYTSFGYFDRKEEDVLVLKNMYASLKSGGACLMEMAGKEYLARIYQPTHSEKLSDGSMLVQNHEVLDNWTRLKNEWTLIRKGRAKTFSFQISIYSGLELMDRMRQVGFDDIQLFGSIDGEAYGINSTRLIALGRKV